MSCPLCKATTKLGKPCKNRAVCNNVYCQGYCSIHKKQKKIGCKIVSTKEKIIQVKKTKITPQTPLPQKTKKTVSQEKGDLILPLTVTTISQVEDFLKSNGYKEFYGKDIMSYYIPPKGAPIYFYRGSVIDRKRTYMNHKEYYNPGKVPADVKARQDRHGLPDDFGEFNYWAIHLEPKFRTELKGERLYLLPFIIPKGHKGEFYELYRDYLGQRYSWS